MPAVTDWQQLGVELDSLNAVVHRLVDQSAEHRRILEHFPTEPPPTAATPDEPFIMTLEDEAYENALDALGDWVDTTLSATYGREISTAAPWCHHWQDHPEAVARLHALKLAYDHHLGPETGPDGIATWQRDVLDPALTTLRAPGGPFAACTTDPTRPAHRVLPGPRATDAHR